MHGRWARPAAIVIGSDHVGSAVAVALDRAGYATVVCDDVDPSWPRRGMAFTDAWYVGNAGLDGATAVFCATVKSIPSVLERPGMIAATTWSWAGAAGALPVAVIVDARPRGSGEGIDLRARAQPGQFTVGIGTGYVAGHNADIAIGSCDDRIAGMVTPTHAARGDARPPTGTHPDAIVRARIAGRFATARHIGDVVRKGEVLGVIGQSPVAAPLAGVLSGLTARGARVREGDEIIEVDPGGDPSACFGLAEGAAALARAVAYAVTARAQRRRPQVAVASET